jgi:hypothetical protein
VTAHRAEWPQVERIPEVERRAWCAWFEQYGVNPRTVATPGFVEADPDAHTFTYLAYVLDANDRIRFRGLNAITKPLTVQLIDGPVPFLAHDDARTPPARAEAVLPGPRATHGIEP